MLQAKEMSGKSQFPFMIDPNNNEKQMLESDAIISYLWEEYGDGNVGLFPSPLLMYTSQFLLLKYACSGACIGSVHPTLNPNICQHVACHWLRVKQCLQGSALNAGPHPVQAGPADSAEHWTGTAATWRQGHLIPKVAHSRKAH